MIVDTSALLAHFDGDEPQHRAVAAAIESSKETLVVSPHILAELDHLLLTRHGTAAEAAVLTELSGGAWELAHINTTLLRAALTLLERHADNAVGVADASNIVPADHHRSRTIVTLDHRHFSVLRLSDGTAPTLLP